MLEGKTYGIFPLLEEECRMPNPKTESFMQKVVSNHKNNKEFLLKKTGSNSTKNSNSFVIRHFGKEVNYSTV